MTNIARVIKKAREIGCRANLDSIYDFRRTGTVEAKRAFNDRLPSLPVLRSAEEDPEEYMCRWAYDWWLEIQSIVSEVDLTNTPLTVNDIIEGWESYLAVKRKNI